MRSKTVMGTRQGLGRVAWGVALVVGLVAVLCWISPRGVRGLGCIAVMFVPLLLMGGVALVLQRARERREAVFGSELREAVRADTAVLHRVTVAIPARDRHAVASCDLGEGHAHRILDSLAPYLSRGVLYAHVVEPLADDGAVADAMSRMTLELEGRVHGETTEATYRDEARERRATAGDEGLVVVSVLVAARPTAQKWRPVLRTRDAKALRDRILPIDPSHVLATALVLTPGAEGPSFDASALREAFPELTPLDETAAVAMEPESAQEPESDAETERDPALLSALLPELPDPVAVIELHPDTVDETIAATLRRLEQHFGLPMPLNSPLTDVLRTAAADLDSAREEYTRERLLTALEVSVNAVLRGARREERLTRLVGSGGRVFVDARFLAIDDETRDALRLRTDVLFAPRPFESLRDVIPMLATLAVFGTFAIHWLGPGVSPSCLIGTAAASLLSRWWVARSNRGLALGAAWKTKYVMKPREPAPPQ